MHRSTITRRAALSGVALLALAACGGSEEPEEAPVEEAPQQVEAPAEEPEASDGGGDEETAGEDDEEGSAAAAGTEGAEVEIGESFTDEATGDTISILSAKRDMPSERDQIYLDEGGEVLYVQFEFTPGDQFGGAISPNAFSIEYGGEEDRAKSGHDEEIEAAGLTAMETVARSDGPSGPLWVGFTVEGERQDSYTGIYIREETKILGEDATIPEFRQEFEIPAP